MKRLLLIAAVTLGGMGCGAKEDTRIGTGAETETGVATETAVGSQTDKTNVVNDSTPVAPGTGPTVGADPTGAGTAPLREGSANEPPR